jgi:pimeloyl-ACP methyl ester carboxylesterase
VQELSKIIAALTTDVGSRFNLDPRRVYLAGMSGGSRVALTIALQSPTIAGVIASSAGYPDSRPRKTLTFPIFSTAGTEDFNHVEMRMLDRELTSPHRLVVFTGGHVWLSSELAVEAVGWMQLMAIKRGVVPRDQAFVDRLFAARTAAVDLAKSDAPTYLAAQAIVDDFTGFEDVTAFAARAAILAKDKGVRDALKRDRDEDDRELQTLENIRMLESRLTNEDEHTSALGQLRQRWKQLSDRARAPEDSAERRFSRRVLSGLSASIVSEDPEYLKNRERIPDGTRPLAPRYFCMTTVTGPRSRVAPDESTACAKITCGPGSSPRSIAVCQPTVSSAPCAYFGIAFNTSGRCTDGVVEARKCPST